MIKKCEINSPSSFTPLSFQVTILPSGLLGTEAGHDSMPEADIDNLSLDIPNPAQVASAQLERAVCQVREEEGAQFWDSSLDVNCSKEYAGVDEVSVSPAQECIGSPFILIVQATDDKDKCLETIVIQQVYKGSHEEYPRMRIYRKGMKYKPPLLDKIKCPKLFEVEDQINPILQLFDEPDDRPAEKRRNSFDGPADDQFLKIHVV